MTNLDNGVTRISGNIREIERLLDIERETEQGENRVSEETTGSINFNTAFQTPFALNRIVFGAPGTGKSYLLEEDRKILMQDGGEYERVTFHPDYSYAHFVGVYKPVSCEDEIKYKFVPGPFIRLLVKALRNSKESTPRPHLLLIEEINRAKVAAVFGDIFQLLDRDDNGVSEYEIHTSEDVKNYLVKELGGLSEQFEKIRIPNNMLIWSTMNSADQGVFPMDTAFKRRWNFEYLGINKHEEAVRGKIVLGNGTNALEVEWNQLRKAINEKLVSDYRVNEDKLMGPFFLSKNLIKINEVDGTIANPEKFKNAFKSKVIMYLYEDAVKMHRNSFFSGCNSNKYSSVCDDFDSIGIKIFGDDFFDLYKQQEV